MKQAILDLPTPWKWLGSLVMICFTESISDGATFWTSCNIKTKSLTAEIRLERLKSARPAWLDVLVGRLDAFKSFVFFQENSSHQRQIQQCFDDPLAFEVKCLAGNPELAQLRYPSFKKSTKNHIILLGTRMIEFGGYFGWQRQLITIDVSVLFAR